MLIIGSAIRRPSPYLAMSLLKAMESTTSRTTSPTSPASSCRWRRGYPVSTRHSSNKSTNGTPAPRSQSSPPQSPPTVAGASIRDQTHSHHVSNAQGIGLLDNGDAGVLFSHVLQHMRLEGSPRAVRFKPTARMEAQHAVPIVTASESIPMQQTAERDSLNQTIGHGRVERARNERAGGEDVEKAGVKESAEHKALSENKFTTQDNTSMKQFSDSEYAPSQDPESSATEQLNNDEEEVEEHITLDYQIPEDILRAAMLASPNTRASFWSAKMYRGPDGQPLSIHYCRSKEVAERVAQYFVKEEVLGFDIEWRPHSSPKSIKHNASLIQLACEDRIALFHVSQFAGSTPEELMPPTLKTILENPDIYKVGVAVKGDFTRLQKHLNIQAQGVFELSRLHNLVELHATDPTKVSNKLVGLAAQVLQHLQLPLYKGEQLNDDPLDTANVRESDWSRPLDFQQIHYAAADAYAGFRLFHILEWKRKQLRPTPPTRGICDYDSKPTPRPKVPRKKTTKKTKDPVNVTAEQSASALEPEPELELEQDQEQDQEESEEEDGYETAPEELMNSHELEDPISGAGANGCSTIDESTRAQKRVGRVNLTWLRGPDPGYPTLPQQSQEDTPNAAHRPDYSAHPTETAQVATSSSDTRLPQLDVEEEDDEFADPELEDALHVMDLDEDGKLQDATSPNITVKETPKNERAGPALDPTNTSKKSLEVDRTHGANLMSLQPQATDMEISDYNPIDLDAEEPIATSPPTFQPLTQADEASHAPEYHAATTWAQAYLQSTIPSLTSTIPSRIRATVPHLRAYHLWHHQNLSLDDIAGHLRDPPLSHSTVAGYILQAVNLERLDYDKDAMRDMMMDMPVGLRKGRWRWIAEKVGAMK